MEKVAEYLPSLFSVEKQLVERATVDDDNPTPGYLLDEIASQTFVSATSCLRILEYLLVKITEYSPNVRYKTLRVLKHLLKKGHELIAHELQKKAEQIRPCLGFSGPPHPFKGETPYLLVRNEAKEVMKLIFGNEEIREPTTLPFSPIKSNDTPSSNAKNILLGGATAIVGSIVKLATPTPENTNELSNFGGPNLLSKELSPQTDFSSTSPDGIWGPLTKETEENRTKYFAESSLVDNFTSSSGVRVSPSQSQLSDFKRGVQQMDISIICRLLEAKLINPSIQWQSKLKALYAISVILETPTVKKYFSEHFEVLTSQLGSTQRSIHDKSVEIIKKIHPNFRIEEEPNPPISQVEVPLVKEKKFERKESEQTPVNAIFEEKKTIKEEEKSNSKPKEGMLVDISFGDSISFEQAVPSKTKYEDLFSPKDSFDFVTQLMNSEKNKS